MSTAVQIHQISKRFLDPVGPFGKPGASFSRPAARFLVQTASITALDRVSFAVEEGEIFGVVGAGGSGKSSLLRLIAGLLLPDEGEVHIFGHNAARFPAQAQSLTNALSTRASFFGKLSPLENILLATSRRDSPESPARQAAIALLKRLGLGPNSIQQPMETLDRAFQPLVGLACALFPVPRLLILDEPMNGLEAESWCKVQEVLLEQRAQHGSTIILTAPSVEPVSFLCDRIALLEDGRLVALGTPCAVQNTASCQGQMTSLGSLFLDACREPARELERA